MQLPRDMPTLLILRVQQPPREVSNLLRLPQHVGIPVLQFLRACSYLGIKLLREFSKSLFALQQSIVRQLPFRNVSCNAKLHDTTIWVTKRSSMCFHVPPNALQSTTSNSREPFSPRQMRSLNA